MAGELIATDWQVEFDGLLMGEGTNIDLVQIDGLLDLQEVITADRARLQRHGLHAGDDFAAGRDVVITLEVWSDTDAELATSLNNVLRALTVRRDETPLVFRLPGVAGGLVARVNARVRRRTAPIDLEFLHRRVQMTVEFFATDPRIYGNSEQVITAPAASPGSGMTWPITWPLQWGIAGASGTVRVINSGSFTTLPTIRIAGPATDPYVENRTTNQVFRLNINVGPGEFIDINSATRSVLLNGRASRREAMERGSQWIELRPGDNYVAYRASDVPQQTGPVVTSGFGRAPFGTSPFGSLHTTQPPQSERSTASIIWRPAWL